MGTQVKNMLIGVFVLVAIGFAISVVLFLKPRVGDGKETIYVRFSNINKIGIGTRVVFAGKPVGEVVAVSEIYEAREQPADILGRVYFYQLTLKIDSSVKIYDTDQISLQTSGLLGEKSVAIIPKVPPKGVTPKLITNEPIYADSVDPIEHAFAEISELADDMALTFTKVNEWLDQNEENLSFAVKSFGQSMDQIDKAVTQFNDLCIIEDVKTVTQELAQGTGTLGRLIKDDDMYLRITGILSKVNTLMNDVNHYGILFHLNKGWQRTRTQRMNWLNALNTPSGFKNYFEMEVDQINTSMSRISALVDKANTYPKKCEIMSSDSFKEDFAELLRQADALSDNLKLFNEQLMQAKCK
jgi:phospholipid/cholesterol/gamma-HCH transport system substrate-binding protein